MPVPFPLLQLFLYMNVFLLGHYLVLACTSNHTQPLPLPADSLNSCAVLSKIAKFPLNLQLFSGPLLIHIGDPTHQAGT